MIFVCGVIEVCINVYLQAWTTSLKPSSPRHVYGAFLGGYAGIQLGFLFAFCVGIFNAYLYAHPIVSRNLHEWQIKGLLSCAFGSKRDTVAHLQRPAGVFQLPACRPDGEPFQLGS